TEKGKGAARKLRASGSVPAVFYSAKSEPVPLTVSAHALERLLKNAGSEFVRLIIKDNGQSQEKEITVTRRLYRSGESEYLINGRAARLRDIQDIFMGTGLGPESYAIIEQGRIGQILSSKPLDRRAVIEEAAGISKFKTKRRLAEAKLEGAKQNLTRVFDILEEVTRQVNSLKRQAAKAKRYEELRTELDGWLRTALAGRDFLLQREIARITASLDEATARHQQLSASVDEGDQALAAARDTFYQLENDLTQARQRLADINVESERTRGQIEAQKRQIASIEQRLQEGEGETETLSARLETLNTEHAHLAEALKALEQQSAEARERLQARNAERDAAQNQLREHERTVEQSRQAAVRLLSEASQLRNQISQIESYLQSIDRDSARLRNEEQAALSDLARLEAARVEFSEKLAGRQLELESIQDRRKALETTLQERRAAATQTRRELDALRQEVSRLRARRDSHEEILSHRSYTTETVKRLFSVIEKDNAERLKPAGVLADFVDLTDPRFEKATEEFLHEELEYVVVKEWADASKGLDVLQANCDGRVTFLVEPNLNADPAAVAVETPPEPPIGPETGIAGRLSDGLRFTNGLTNAPAALLPRLARCYLAEDRDSAARLARMYPDLFFLLSDGVCYHGHAVSAGRKTGSGPLALKRELRELTLLHDERHAAFTASQARLDTLEAEIHSLSEELELLRADQQKQEKETLIIDQEMRKLAEESRRSNQRLSIARVELDRIARDSAAQIQQRDQNLSLLQQREAERAAQEAAYELGKAALEGLRQTLNSLAEEHSVARVELSTLDERRRGTELALNRLEQQLRELSNRRSSLAAELERLALQRTRLLENNLELDQKAASLADEAAHFTETVASLAAREAEFKENLSLAEEQLKTLRQQVAEAQDARAQIELDLVRRQSGLKYLDETCRKDLGLSLAELNPPPPGPVALTAGWLALPGGALLDLAGATIQPDRSITLPSGDIVPSPNP
ncbi:MAG: chromosome segregation protein SMC, partial [Bryobacteraceae bacterium]|nr:chromosome segregation protein SMC [Bryobacteraceae bacterium]